MTDLRLQRQTHMETSARWLTQLSTLLVSLALQPGHGSSLVNTIRAQSKPPQGPSWTTRNLSSHGASPAFQPYQQHGLTWSSNSMVSKRRRENREGLPFSFPSHSTQILFLSHTQRFLTTPQNTCLKDR